MKNNQNKPYDSSKNAGSQDKSASQNRPGFEKSADSSKVTTGYDKAQPKQAATPSNHGEQAKPARNANDSRDNRNENSKK